MMTFSIARNRTILLTLAIVLGTGFGTGCGGPVNHFDDDSGGDADAPGDTTTDSADDTPGDTPGDSTGDSAGDTPGDTPGDTAADTIGDIPADVPLTDGDGDTITDWHEGEGAVDTDADDIPDSADTDSDGDGILDSVEAGDADLATAPLDTDSDTIPDYRDRDSDDDGLTDSDEVVRGTDPRNPDSDGDGASDLAEIAYGTDPLDDTESPLANGDFVFIMPWNDAPDPAADTLVFSTSYKMADVFFLMDTTGSMGTQLSALRAELSTVIIPGIQAIIPDVRYGVGQHEDYPISTYGSSGDVVFAMLQRMTPNAVLAQNAVNALALGSGNDLSESQVPALWAIATGSGLGPYLTAAPACGAGEVGYPCFRSSAASIIVLITDATFHNGPGSYEPYAAVDPVPPTYAEAIAALNAINARVITIWRDGYSTLADDHCQQLSTDTQAVDALGNPLSFGLDASGTGLGDFVVNAIDELVTGVPIRVDAMAHDDPSDFVDAIASFVLRVETNTSGSMVWDPVAGEMRACTSGIPIGTPGTPPTVDYFNVVQPGQSVCFDIIPLTNTTVPATTVPLIFRATIDVIGDLYTPLDSRDVWFIVPPAIAGG